MRCSNCGKDIPFTGNVCPYCHVDKSGDQTSMVFGMIFGVIGGGLGWAIAGPGVAFIGLIVGVIIGLVFASKANT